MTKRTSEAFKRRVKEQRIQRAVSGLQIPLTQVTALYRHAELAIAGGADDDALRDTVKLFLGLPLHDH